ncbi:hypothetical protein [Gimesia sp.]|uniref:hypothetical protein n=1 Tax=Gimesia sp. TaxID=2024833 RepID=UPI003A8CE8A6
MASRRLPAPESSVFTTVNAVSSVRSSSDSTALRETSAWADGVRKPWCWWRRVRVEREL